MHELVFHFVCASSRFHVEGNVPISEVKQTTYIGSMKKKDFCFPVLSVGGRAGQEAFLSATACLSPAGRWHVSSCAL